MLVLERKGQEVYHNDNKLTINKQETKGKGKEVAKIDGLDGSNGQKWFSLSKLSEGMNEVECKGREVTSSRKYTLTTQEQTKVDGYQSKIDLIVNDAKSRYVPKPKNVKNPLELKGQERVDYIASLKQLLVGMEVKK
jgi:hypothetical protein